MTDDKRLIKNDNIKQAMKSTLEKRSLQQCAVYTIKIDESRLTTKQKEQLKMLFVEAKWLYNDMLSFSQEHNISEYDTKIKSINVMNKNREIETRELNFIGSQMKQSVLASIISSIKTLSTLKKKGHKVGALKYSSDYKSLNLKQYGNTYKIYSHNKMKIQGVSGKITVNGLKQCIYNPDIEFANAKILNTPKGYYIAITTYTYKTNLPIKQFIGLEIGIDMGIKDAITLSNGEKFSATIGETERLKRLQRKLARQKKGSNNRWKTRLLIKKECQKITNRKNDAANKVVAHILSFEHVYMQDEQISGWHKGLFGKQVQHSILGRVKMKLINHPRVEVLDRWAPTTKWCPKCGNKNTDITLADRMFKCPHCGHTNDRDIHSAQNMITMIKIINKQIELVPMGHREFKPVESMKLVDAETGRLHH